VLEPADRRSDAPSLLVGLFVMANFDNSVFLAGYYGLDALSRNWSRRASASYARSAMKRLQAPILASSASTLRISLW
jgi:hypothetical protein